jgi:deoxyguanosine kinase
MLHKLILFEGVDGSGKTLLAKMLAKKMGGLYYHSPPVVLEPLKQYANNASFKVRYQYFMLGNYIVSEELKELLLTQDVVLDKYFYSTIAFHSILLKSNLSLPKDLLMPDHTFYLTASMEEIKRRLNLKEKITKYEELSLLQEVDKKYKEIFKENPNITTIETTNKTPSEILKIIEQKLI